MKYIKNSEKQVPFLKWLCFCIIYRTKSIVLRVNPGRPTRIVIDNFAGDGGASTGIELIVSQAIVIKVPKADSELTQRTPEAAN